MRFAYPHLLWLALLVPVMLLFFWRAERIKRALMTQFVSARLLPALLVGVSQRRQTIRTALLATVVGLLAIVLARPQWGFALEEVHQRGLDVVVAIDTSRSMLATDIASNRLERAKLAAFELADLARSDRLGLIPFAGTAFLQCPLSLDDEAFRQSVAALDPAIIPQGGSALAEAIRTASAAFEEGIDNHKVLILFSDGEDHEGEAIEAARAAAESGLRIFTIGIGTPAGELIRSAEGGFLKDEQGNVVKSRLNEPLLQQIAAAGNGFYIHLAGAKTMQTLYERGLAPLPKGEFATRTMRRFHERFQWFLGLALGLLWLETLLPEGKTTRKNSLAPVTPTSTLLLLCLAVLCSNAAVASPNKALEAYRKGRFESAWRQFERLARKSPEDARLHFNAGTAAFQAGRFDDAQRDFRASLSATDLELQQRAYYNLGNTEYRLGEAATDPKERQQHWETALGHYETALKLKDDPDARFNRDLVKQKLDELKQQQQQQKNQQQKQQEQENQDNQQQQEGQQDQQQPKDSKSQSQQKKPESQPPSPPSQPDQKPKESSRDSSNTSPQPKPSDKPEPANPQKGSGEQPQNTQAAEAGKPAQMTPQQAAQILDMQRGEQKILIFLPEQRTNRPSKSVRDW